MSNFAPGQALEEATASVFAASGAHVEREQIIGHKKVDLLLVESRFGTITQTAVECKDLSANLTLHALRSIWLDYEPLIQKGLVDELLVVTTGGHSAAAVTYAKDCRGLHLQDFDSLTRELLGMSPYLEALRSSYEESADGLAHYYINPSARLRSQGIENAPVDLELAVRQWIVDSPDSQLDPDKPVAILGAYGQGKSSFASHLAAVLAEDADRNAANRIPVLIRLGEIDGNQLLSGLLGRHFTDLHNVRGYNFEIFKRLNSGGRFVVILDGFDEMKQLLTWNEFCYNLSELNLLHSGSSKLLILGRPTAFLSDDEHNFALHGERHSTRLAYRDPDWPDYQELILEPLSRDQIAEFLTNYLNWRESVGPGGVDEIRNRVTNRHLLDLARRPVQLRMLADVLPGYRGEIDELNVGLLYSLFLEYTIHEVIQRENKKASRLHFTVNERRRFISDLAFWLWTHSHSDVLIEEDIPDALVSPFIGEGEDLDAVRRDLFVAAPLDRRTGERARFAHKSFQEFLVAEVIWARLMQATMSLGEADALSSGEVSSFLNSFTKSSNARRRLEILNPSRDPLSIRFVTDLLLDSDVASEILAWDNPSIGSWSVIVSTLYATHSRRDHSKLGAKELPRLLRTTSNPTLAIFCTLYAWDFLRNPEDLLDGLLSALFGVRTPERMSATAVEERIAIWPLDNDYVLDLRSGEPRIGRIPKGRRVRVIDQTRLRLEGGNDLQVGWLGPEFTAFASRSQFGSQTRVDTHGWRPYFAQSLIDGPHIKEWIDSGSLSGNVKLPGNVTVGEIVRQQLYEANTAINQAGTIAAAARRLHTKVNSKKRGTRAVRQIRTNTQD